MQSVPMRVNRGILIFLEVMSSKAGKVFVFVNFTKKKKKKEDTITSH